MAATFYGPKSTSGCTLSTSHTCRLDGIVVIACTLVVRNQISIVKEVLIELRILDYICITVIKTGVLFIIGNVHALQAKVCINPKEQRI
jgi:hypothetical protein